MATQRERGRAGAEVAADQEQDALFNSTYPCAALYYVQSPSTASHANSPTSSDAATRLLISNPSTTTALLSPFPHLNNHNNNTNNSTDHRNSRLALSRYSSSRGSSYSFNLIHEKIKSTVISKSGGLNGVETTTRRERGSWRFVSVDLNSASCFCVLFHVLWRLVACLGIALLVFFLATKPPSPSISFKVVGFKQFRLGEGLDSTGVVTKILSSNCSVDMEIDNHSKVFGLHVHPPTLEMAFGHVKLATSQGPRSFVESDSSYTSRICVVAKNRPVYGAGRSMEDMLESGQGLPLMIRMRTQSTYRVVWNLIRLHFRHHDECLLVLDGSNDEKHAIRIRNSTCTSTTHHA